ncbi:hypothetical protein L6E12_09010 [Actinokineospora sp. PR83]|uniref:hypothetical protein n=1 Tax=Actinokineospora sp. PR83 TaxID=2884908 RepID=UPI001F30ACCC|nr:hypothetical protein [Actinokineospora sp. PR83]MCG8915926.1 hypothetical protein [Actinokineospora sp. PR83]
MPSGGDTSRGHLRDPGCHRGHAYTAAGLGKFDGPALRVLADDLSLPPSGQARMRVVNAGNLTIDRAGQPAPRAGCPPPRCRSATGHERTRGGQVRRRAQARHRGQARHRRQVRHRGADRRGGGGLRGRRVPGRGRHRGAGPPGSAAVAGWFAAGAAAGSVGPALPAGHVDFHAEPGTRRSPKADFPTAEVHAPTPGPELRLVTCGGAFDHAARSHRDNVIVEATPAGA